MKLSEKIIKIVLDPKKNIDDIDKELGKGTLAKYLTKKGYPSLAEMLSK